PPGSRSPTSPAPRRPGPTSPKSGNGPCSAVRSRDSRAPPRLRRGKGGRRVTSREYDEEDVRVRPARRSRPRTKIRPKHADAREGFVTAVDRGRYTCLVEGTAVTAMKARELGRQSIVVGDRAALVGDLSGREGTLARIVRIAPRHGELRRSADDE